MNQDDGAASQMDRLEIVVDRDKGATSQSEHLENGPARVAPQINPNPEIDSDLRKRTVRKLDFNVLPIVTALYLCSFLDRSNIGNAQTAGLSKALHLSSSEYQWLLTIFYIPYILFEWGALMWKVIPPHIWAFACVTLWGLAASLQAVTQNFAGMMACRFFLAAAESMYGPGIPFLLSFFYMRNELGLRCGLFLSAAPFATCFAGALAYGITSGHSKLQNWRLLFLVEGLPSLCMAVVAFFYLPDNPEKCRYLTREEKDFAKSRAIRQAGLEPERRLGMVKVKDVLAALVDPKNYLTALMYFSCNVSFSSLPVFLPTIIKGMGYSSINAQGLTAPPYFLAGIVSILSTYLADRYQQRGIVIIITSLIGAIGYVLLASTEVVGVRYLGIFLAAAGMFPAIFNIAPWVLNNQGTDSKRGTGIVILNLIGQTGPLVGTRLYPAHEGPRYVKGMSICAAFMFFNALLACALRTYLVWLNKKAELAEAELRARIEDAISHEKSQQVAVENEGYGFRNFL